MDAIAGLPLIKAINSDLFPIDRLDPSGGIVEIFSNILVTSYKEEDLIPGPGERFEIGFTVAKEAVFNLIGLEGFSLVFGGASSALFTFSMSMWPDRWEVRIGAGARLRFPHAVLKPVRKDGDQWVDDSSRAYVDLDISAGIIIDQDWNVTFDGTNAFHLDSAMVANSGLVIEGEVALDLSETTGLPESAALGLPPTWRGVIFKSLKVYLPDAVTQAVPVGSFSFSNFHIGSGGVTGSISLNGTPGDGTIGGFPFRPTAFEVELRQNCLVRAEIEGQLTLTFFDEPLGIRAGFDLDGNFTVAVAAASGLVDLVKPDILSLTVDSISFALRNSVFTVNVAGTLKPLLGGFDWPSFQIKALTIDSAGNVHLDGGWLNLREQYSFSFYGFQMEITKLGFGKTDDGGKWVGFSGSLKLVEGLSAGASVEGLRIIWYDDGGSKLTFNGIGVEFEVPDVLRFKGAVSFDDQKNEFAGSVKLNLLVLDMSIDSQLVIGQYNSDFYMGVHLALDLPAGIPLWSTGLALYGMEGFFALQMVPKKTPEQQWYGIDRSKSWYHQPFVGVIGEGKEALDKWKPAEPNETALALGAGVTLGTLSDNGYLFSGKMLLVISFPGPILLIEGRANLLKERAKLSTSDEPNFRALAVLDFRAGSFLFGLDAQYKYGDSGQLIDIGGSAEVMFNFTDATAWHLYLGQKEPREKRIRAQFLSVFEANAYLMLDANQLATGAWIGFSEHWSFGPLGVTAEAWIESNAVISWKPPHFHGDLWLHGRAALEVFWFDFGLSLDAQIAADVFDPFHILAELRVGVDLPWPLPDFDVGITLEWGPSPERPPLPLPLKEVAIEHFKVTTSWPLPRGTLLLPNYDQDSNGYRDEQFETVDPDLSPAAIDFSPSNISNIPVVPIDSRPHITFARPVHDDAIVGFGMGNNPDPESEQIGDPQQGQGPVKARYGLKEVTLERWDSDSGQWQRVARKAAEANQHGVEPLYGSWAPVPRLAARQFTAEGTAESTLAVDLVDPSGKIDNTKLWLWSKNPFDYLRPGGTTFAGWLKNYLANYPCPPLPPDKTIWYSFQNVGSSQGLTSPWSHPNERRLVFYWIDPSVPFWLTLLEPFSVPGPGAIFNVLRFELPQFQNAVQQSQFLFDVPYTAKTIHLLVTCHETVTIHLYSADGTESEFTEAYSPFDLPSTYPVDQRPARIDINTGGVKKVRVEGYSPIYLLAVGFTVGPTEAELKLATDITAQLKDAMESWSAGGEAHLLKPYSTYRLQIVTTLQTSEFADEAFNRLREQREVVFFRTEGPPGFAKLSPPIDHPDQKDFERKIGLDDLTRYVTQTLPKSVLGKDEKPLLPGPFYRAYDISVDFDKDRADLFYSPIKRDVQLYLFDNNNQPVRDVHGEILPLFSDWKRQGAPSQDELEEIFAEIVNESGCVTVDPKAIYPSLTAVGYVLAPDTIYEARVKPALLSEDFGDYSPGQSVDGKEWRYLGGTEGDGFVDTTSGEDSHLELITSHSRWRVVNEADIFETIQDFPSHWEIRSSDNGITKNVVQISKIGLIYEACDYVKGICAWDYRTGTILYIEGNANSSWNPLEQPNRWTDFRLTLSLCSSDEEGAIGVVFRGYRYRFLMSKEKRILFRVNTAEGGEGIPGMVRFDVTYLAEDSVGLEKDKAYLTTLEVVGSRIRIFQDHVLVFDITDKEYLSAPDYLSPPTQGRIGLFSSQNAGACFSDIRVDDLSENSRKLYSFKFRTSKFANFFHHFHSYQDETWRAALTNPLLLETSLTDLNSEKSPVPSAEEARSYSALAKSLLNEGAVQIPPTVEITLVESQDKVPLGWLVRSPEPFDWERTFLEVYRIKRAFSGVVARGKTKLTDVVFKTPQDPVESVIVLLRDALSLKDYRLEYRSIAEVESVGAQFGEFQVAPLAANRDWILYHQFDDEALLPAGSRVRIYTGLPGYQPLADTGVVQIPSNTESPSFPESGVELRLVDPFGAASHQRCFYPNSFYESVYAQVLRSDDGTGLFLRVPALSSEHQYRLKAVFRRKLPVGVELSQSGNSDPEVVVLDIPNPSDSSL